MLTAHQMFLPKHVTSNYLQSLQVLLSTGKCCLESELNGHELPSVRSKSETLSFLHFINFINKLIFDDQIGAGSRLWCVDKILCGYEKRCNLLLEISRRCR